MTTKKELDMSEIMRILTKRKRIEDEWTLKDGVVQDPGKFEGEMLYVIYFWNLYLDGWSDSDDSKILSFKVTAEDKAVFPELGRRRKAVKLYEDDQGFVNEL